MVIFQCVSGYSRKKNTYFTKFHITDTRKNSHEQKKASHRLLRIRVSAYQAKKNHRLRVGPSAPKGKDTYVCTLAACGLEERRNFEELLTESVGRVHFS